MVKDQVVSPGQSSVKTPTTSVWSQTHAAVGANVAVGLGDGAGVVGAGVVGTADGADVDGAGVIVGAAVTKQSRNAKASILPAPKFP